MNGDEEFRIELGNVIDETQPHLGDDASHLECLAAAARNLSRSSIPVVEVERLVKDMRWDR